MTGPGFNCARPPDWPTGKFGAPRLPLETERTG